MKILVVRYGTNIINNCIELHQNVIQDTGFCWFGKIGRVPSKKIIDTIMGEEEKTIILYSRAGGIYMCSIEEITATPPQENYPEYYDSILKANGYKPSIYFKLTSITEIKYSDLSKYIIVSTKGSLTETLNHSMNSLFLAAEKKDFKASSGSNHSSSAQQSRLSKKDCKYRVNQKCTLKSCVNYQYECLHPDICIKQKI